MLAFPAATLGISDPRHFLLSWLFSLIREGLEASPGAAVEAGGQRSHRPESLQDGFWLWG